MKITRRQLRKIVKEAIDPQGKWYDDEAGHETLADRKFADRQQSPAHEDNQTRMVRRYLIQLGIGDSFFNMNEEQIDSMAADLRLMSPSVKKLRDLYDLSVPTDIWQRNRNLGQTPDGSNLQRINQMMANRPDDDDPAYASEFGSHLDDDEELAFLQQSDEQRRDDDAMTGGPWYYEGDDEA